jgi:CubicO group peptidase (beta-lactamase class C family)
MASATGFSDEGLARLDAVVAGSVEQQQVPGVVAAIARDATVHVACAGVMAVGGGPMQRDTMFRIASITKPMTAAVVLSLVADGLFELDEPVERLLPELAVRRVLRRPDGPLDDTVPARRAITVRDLLTFTWGFGMQGAMFMAPEPWPVCTAAADLHTLGEPRPDSTPDPDTWMARLAELPLMVQPGERWLNSSGSQVLGVLAARAAGASFDQVMRDRLFVPLGLDDTAFYTTDAHRLATSYARHDGRLEVHDAPDGQWSHPPAFPDGAGGLVSTADDVITFGRMLLRGGDPVLALAAVAEMTSDQLTPGQRSNQWDGFDMLDGRGWGYGVSVLDDGRYAWDGGLGTTWSNVPSDDLTVVVLTQRMWDGTGPPAVCADVLEAARAAVV